MQIILTKLFNLIGKTQKTPSAWNESAVVPIFKNKGNPLEIKNYRPISLTIVCKRLFEKIIDSRLDSFKKMLQDSQSGFRQGRSTLHQVYYLMELMKCQDISQVFLDFRAAYDLVDRRVLWTTLYKRFKMPLTLIRMMRSLMDNNFSKLVIGCSKSRNISQLRGLPQGSSLSPTLFNFYIDSLIVLLENKPMCSVYGLPSNNLFFADDGAIHATSQETLQNLVDVCYTWSLSNGMIFAADKCLVLSKNPSIIHMGEYVLPQVDRVNYLGIPITENGPDFDSLISAKCEKAVNATMMVVRSGFTCKLWSFGIKASLYKQFIRPVLEYGLQLTICSKKQIDLLNKYQCKCIRLLMNLPWNLLEY
jgi:hypothetical protein